MYKSTPQLPGPSIKGYIKLFVSVYRHHDQKTGYDMSKKPCIEEPMNTNVTVSFLVHVLICNAAENFDISSNSNLPS